MASRLLLRHARTSSKSFRVHNTTLHYRPGVGAASRQNVTLGYRTIRSHFMSTKQAGEGAGLLSYAPLFGVSTVGIVAALLARTSVNDVTLAEAPPANPALEHGEGCVSE